MSTPTPPPRSSSLRGGPLRAPQTGKPQKRAARPNVSRKVNEDGKIKMRYKVPKCAAHYLACLVDPFTCEPGVCIPADIFPLPSQKIKVFARGKFALGTSGIGFIQACPTVSNNHVTTAAVVTSATSVGNAAAAFTGFTATVPVQISQIPYTDAQILSTVHARIVSYGIRVKYSGKLLDRGGVCVGMEDPDHLDMTSLSYNTMSSNIYSSLKRVGDDEWDMSTSYSGPVAPSDIEFSNVSHPLGIGCMMTIAISGTAGDPYDMKCMNTSNTLVPPLSERLKVTQTPYPSPKPLKLPKQPP